MIRRRVLAPFAIVVAVLAGGIVGAVLGVPALSGAQESTTTQPGNPPDGPFAKMHAGGDFAAAAKALDLTTEQLLEKLSDGKTTIADIAKQQNVDINTVIDAMASADRQRIEDMVNNPLPKFGDRHGPGPGMRKGFAFGGPMALDSAAKALGMSQDALITELRGGKTIAQVAKEKSVAVDTVISAMVASANARIDRAQANGLLTKERADAAKSKVKALITEFVNEGMPKPPAGWPMGGFGHGGPRGLRDGLGIPRLDDPSA
jgi:hypothetical protein